MQYTRKYMKIKIQSEKLRHFFKKIEFFEFQKAVIIKNAYKCAPFKSINSQHFLHLFN